MRRQNASAGGAVVIGGIAAGADKGRGSGVDFGEKSVPGKETDSLIALLSSPWSRHPQSTS